MISKTINLDKSSLYLRPNEMVRVTLRTMQDREETFEALYMGAHQLAAYTTPYFIFLMPKEKKVRLINANDVRSIEYGIKLPDIANQLLLPGVEEEEDEVVIDPEGSYYGEAPL